MRSVSLALCAGAAACLATPVRAETPAVDSGRFSMSPTEGGFLRLDKETGVVSFCTVTDGLSLCRVSADERAALEEEIARLRRENAELKQSLSPAPPKIGSNKTEEEFERALSFTERFMRRMMRIFREEAPKS
jgi:hypothetical protein